MAVVLLFVAVVLAASGLATLGYVIVGTGDSRPKALANLRRGNSGKVTKSLAGRSVQPSPFARLIPQFEIRWLDQLHAKAGRPVDWPMQRVINMMGALTVVGLALVAFCLLASPSRFLLVLLLALLLHSLPMILLYNTGIKRRQAITLELADTLDQMSIAVAAGLGFEAAMLRVAQNSQGILARELQRTMQDIQVGQPRRDAYEALAERADVADLRRFLRSIVQAEQFGLALNNVLETHANEMRLKRKQRAEEKAMQIPVKVVFPLVMCILPVLFIVVMGPAVIRIMGTMGR